MFSGPPIEMLQKWDIFGWFSNIVMYNKIVYHIRRETETKVAS